jgi:MFS family permease
LGGESLAVTQNAYAVIWFKGKELNMVFGLLLSVSRIGSTVNMNINQNLFNDGFSFITNKPLRLGVVLLVGFGFCLLSLIAGVALGLFDRRAAKITKRKKGEGEKISLRDIKDFSLSLWLIFFICVAYYVTVFPFIGVATVFVEDKYGLRAAQANIINSLVYLISAVASPFLGFAVDKTGFNLFWRMLNLLSLLPRVHHVYSLYSEKTSQIAPKVVLHFKKETSKKIYNTIMYVYA